MRDQLADGITITAVIGGAQYMKWAAAPVLIAFELGRLFERWKARGRQASAR